MLNLKHPTFNQSFNREVIFGQELFFYYNNNLRESTVSIRAGSKR